MLSNTDVPCAGGRLRVHKGGRGPALLLLHSAWGDAAMSWERVWGDLAGRFTVIAPDMPGFGASEPPPERSLAGIAGLLRDLLDEMRVDRTDVIGNSFGVAVALELAARFPERVGRLIAVNGTALPNLPALMKKVIALPVIRERFRRAMRSMTYSDKAFGKAFPDRSALPPSFFEMISAYEEQHARVVYDVFLHQSAPQRKPDVPASILWGTGDRLTGLRQADSLRKWLDNAPFTPIEGAGHMPQVERPKEFVAALRGLLAA